MKTVKLTPCCPATAFAICRRCRPLDQTMIAKTVLPKAITATIANTIPNFLPTLWLASGVSVGVAAVMVMVIVERYVVVVLIVVLDGMAMVIELSGTGLCLLVASTEIGRLFDIGE